MKWFVDIKVRDLWVSCSICIRAHYICYWKNDEDVETNNGCNVFRGQWCKGFYEAPILFFARFRILHEKMLESCWQNDFCKFTVLCFYITNANCEHTMWLLDMTGKFLNIQRFWGKVALRLQIDLLEINVRN